MALGKLLTRSTRYTVADTLTGATAVYTIADGLGPDWASSSAYSGAMSIPAGWRGALTLANLLGQVPWHAYRTYGGAPEEKINPNPVLLEQPAPPDTRMTTFSSFGLDYVWHGNAIGLWAARNAYGSPTAVIPVPAEFVQVRRITPYSDSPLPVGALEYAVGSMRLSSAEVLHIKGPCQPGAVRGMGVLENHFATINLARDQQRQAAAVSQSGVPTGLITTDDPDMGETELALLKEQWLANQASRTVQALSAAVKFQAIAWTPEESQLVEARKFTYTEWENIFGLPIGWLGGQARSGTYANIEQDAINILKFSHQDKISQFEQTLSLAFPRGTEVRANLDSTLRPDTKTRYEAHAIAIQAGFLTKDEVREIEHRPPLPPEPKPEPPVQATAVVGDQAAVELGQPGQPMMQGQPMKAVGPGPAAP